MPPSTNVRSETPTGGRKPSEDTRAKLREAGQRAWAALTPEQQQARRDALAAGRTARNQPRPPATPDPVAPPVEPEGPRSPLHDAPRADRGRPAPASRPEGLNRGAPVFRVPDFAALPEPEPLEPIGGEFTDVPPAGGVQVSQAQVESLLKFPFAFMALRRGKHWKLRDDEAEMVAEPLTRKLNESAIASRAIAAGGDWAVIIGGLVIIVSGRLAEDAKDDERAGRRAGGSAEDGSRAGGIPAADDHGDGQRPPLRSVGGHGGGTINGLFAPGPDGLGGPAPVAPEARGRPLVQAL
jgi:hypothetical protein